MHRPANVDDPGQAAADRRRCSAASRTCSRWSCRSTRAAGRRSRRPACVADDRLRVVDPLGYVDFLSLVRGAALVVTDSGGIQEETTILGVPVPDGPAEHGATDHDHATARTGWSSPRPSCRSPDAILAGGFVLPDEAPPLWDGHAGERIADVIVDVARARQDRRARGGGPAGVVTGTASRLSFRKQHTVRGARQASVLDAPRPAPRTTPVPGGSVTQDRRVAVIGLGYVGLPLAIAFVEAGLEVEGIDASPGRVAELNARTSPIDDVSDERLGAALDGGLRVVVAGRRARCPRRTRSSSASRRRSRRPRTRTSRRSCRAAETIREHLRAGPADRPPVDDVPRHDDRSVPRGRRAERADGRHRLRPRLRPRAGEPRRPRQRQRRASRASSARRRRRPRSGPPRCCATSTTRSSSCRRRTRPSWRSCSRTSSATSTSRSSTSSPCCASGWASTSGRSSTRRPRSRSGS